MRLRTVATAVLVTFGLVALIYGFLFGSMFIMAVGAASLALSMVVSYLNSRTPR